HGRAGGRAGRSRRTHESRRRSHQQQSCGAVAGPSASLAERPARRRDRDHRRVLRRVPGAQLAQGGGVRRQQLKWLGCGGGGGRGVRVPARVPRGWVLCRQGGVVRPQQLKWLACGGAVAAVSLILAVSHGVWFLAGLAALPVGIGVGILRYRLYDLDRSISRPLAYALVTGLLIGLYVGLVLLATEVFRFHSTVAVAAAT